MAWVKVGYGIWGDDAQDLADEFVERFVGVRGENGQNFHVWGELVPYLRQFARELQGIDASEYDKKSESLNQILTSRTEEFLWSFKRVYEINIGRLPNWDELVHAVGIAADQLGVREIPESLRQVGLADAIELEEVCYVCWKSDQPDNMIATNLTDRIFVHESCLAPSQTEAVDIELSYEEVVFLVNWSNKVNLSINLLIARILNRALGQRRE